MNESQKLQNDWQDASRMVCRCACRHHCRRIVRDINHSH